MTNKIYQKDYFGFIYMWHDLKRNMYYIGSHMGDENDGYVCSQARMRNARTRRPDTFKRIVIQYIINDDRDLLLKEERKWLSLIQNDELNVRFYNACKNVFSDNRDQVYIGVKNHWEDPEKRETHVQSMKKSWTPERKAAHAEKLRRRWKEGSYKERPPISDEVRKQQIETKKTRERKPYSPQAIENFKAGAKQRANTPKHKERFKELMSTCERTILRGEDVVSFGKQWYNNGIEQKRFDKDNVPSDWILGTLKKKCKSCMQDISISNFAKHRCIKEV